MIKSVLKEFNKKRSFYIRTILPPFIAFFLSAIVVFAFIIPRLEKDLLLEKKKMVQSLNQTAWSILDFYYQESVKGNLTRKEAQSQSLSRIEYMKYGADEKDYFWIIDMEPQMIMHPYRKELVGQNLSNYSDAKGKKLFMEAVTTVKMEGEGYISYMWQKRDDSLKIVPKISFVKGFEPWKWIVGTGIYLDDVSKETRIITRNFVLYFSLLLIIVTLIIIILLRNSIKFDKERQIAEKELVVAKEKYQAIAEASTEGTLVVLEDNTIHANKNIQDILGYTVDDIKTMSIFDLISQDQVNAYLGDKYFKYLMLGIAKPKNFEARIRKKNGQFIKLFLTCSRIIFSDKNAALITVKDTELEKIVQQKLGLEREKYKDLINIIHNGVFRASTGNEGKITEVNQAFIDILGYTNENEIYNKRFIDLFCEQEDQKEFIHILFLAGFVKNYPICLIKKDGTRINVSLSAVIVRDNEQNAVYMDGLLMDKTTETLKIKEKEDLIMDLQTSLSFLNQPIVNFASDILKCELTTPIQKAVSMMIKAGRNAIMVADQNKNIVGIVTDHDLRKRVLAEKYDLNRPVFEIMSSPVICIYEQSCIYEAILKMKDMKVGHLGIKNDEGAITFYLTGKNVLAIQQTNTSYLLHKINISVHEDDLQEIQKQIYPVVQSLIQTGVNASKILQVISGFADAVTEKLCSLAVQKIGPPPVPFCFISLGSEGRQEQTLLTDQDNAIIYGDSNAEDEAFIQDYFLKFGHFVCNALDRAGYQSCKGNFMAVNPNWCQALSVWKTYYSNWINDYSVQELLEVSAFFDFRPVYGDYYLADELRQHIFSVCKTSETFYHKLSEGLHIFKPPISKSGELKPDRTLRHPEAINLKNVLMGITGIVRIYAIYNSVNDTNTLKRMDKLLEIGAIDNNMYSEIEQAFNFLMLLRFREHSKAFENNFTADNYINPGKLNEIEISMIKKIFSEILILMTKLINNNKLFGN